ncbi:DUF3857 domain-containing protein [Hymenobacter lutimineralis]|uniref:DUF3857 domain-containing protein n=1 Tax=Hymenobacter lutimineralis TaxID=2606448 RepID=A0A5D6V290_9BACT|nr:DUF3857 domain-containing protein [Hymenobacter lutimineralis]TYZ09666.1 DUF3857 domain-containing protein [Hymenobacter lutimineralis]
MKSIFVARHLAALAICLLLAPAVLAQNTPANLRHAAYSWQAKRARLPISAADAQLPAVVVRDFTAHEYLFDEGEKNLQVYSTEHRIVRVNSADAIERFNKIYIPVQDGGQLLSIKARTISPSGEIVEVNQSNIKELKDDDGDRRYKIFAVEGVEKGSEIEYLYTRSRPLRLYGRDYLQSETPARDVTFELISPEALRFDVRIYHGPKADRDTVVQGKRITRLHLAQVAPAREEAFANVTAEQMRVEYKLAYNQARGNTRLFTWTDASQYLHQNIYTLSKDENKAVDKLLKQINVSAGATPEAKVQAAEHYVKSNFNLDPGADTNLTQAISTRNASESVFTKLFAALFNRLGVEHELGFTTGRDQAVFDETFDTWNYLDNAVFYFPATKQWLAPGRPDYRYGMIPAEWTANQGLFIRTVKLGSTESAVGKVRPIPTLTAAQTSNDLDVKVQFSPALDKTTVDIRQVFGGYNAQAIQPYYSFIPEDKRTEAMQELVKANVKDATFKALKVTNGEAGLSPLTKPFIVDATVESGALLNRAGPRYLFHIGELIGPQSELYQTEERQFDVENEFNRSYHRVISFELPAGYQVRNLQDLTANVQAGPDAKAPVYYFRSGYQQQGQKITVTIDEVYDQIRWPKKDFEAYRSVINAAANFNKVVLVLEKKS